VTAETDSIQDLPTPSRSATGPLAVGADASDEQLDLELVAAVARGDSDAVRALATRLAPRVERVARALMGNSLDARDAAHHALVELLRGHASYRGKPRLERWADRAAAVSVMRFAHAVARRSGPGPAPASAEHSGAARTFEQYLSMLGESSRQQLLLRHALGFGIAELAEIMQCSAQGARERLLAARRELRALVRRRESNPPLAAASPGGTGVQRWCSLCDRVATGESLVPEEQDELARLEAKEPEVWAYVAQVRALELYFDTRAEQDAPVASALIDRAVEALEVSLPTLRTRAILIDTQHDGRVEREPSNWVGVFAWAASTALAAATALAVYWHRPSPVPQPPLVRDLPPAAVLPVVPPPPPPTPTVESLPSVRTASRGARLRSEGHALPEGSVLSQGDTLEAGDKAGCLELDPAFEACLAADSSATIGALQPGARQQLVLERGRIVVRGREPGARLSVVADHVRATSERGALALERAPDGLVRVRALRGDVTLNVAGEERQLAEGEGAQVQPAEGALTIAAVEPSWLQRDWDVLATGLHPVARSGRSSRTRGKMPKLDPDDEAR
jgi:DNA-directed RNA polymerase specialized sigma24 family protein